MFSGDQLFSVVTKETSRVRNVRSIVILMVVYLSISYINAFSYVFLVFQFRLFCEDGVTVLDFRYLHTTINIHIYISRISHIF